MISAHSGQPNCLFCFLPFQGYPALRKHCREEHEESRNQAYKGENKNKENVPTGRTPGSIPAGGIRRRPCRFFRNGEGVCSPRSGRCDFDHSVIPFSEREECFHKQSCRYKPFCIFYHPEGQNENEWETNAKKVARIFKFAERKENVNQLFE